MECYKSLNLTFEKCNIPCKGVYADVVSKEGVQDLKIEKTFFDIFNKYKAYKSGVTDNKNEG